MSTPIQTDDEDTVPTDNEHALADIRELARNAPRPEVVDVGAATSRGSRRPDNQDRWGSCSAPSCFALADGMGGYEGGADAAAAAITAFLDGVRAVEEPADWRWLIAKTNQAVVDVADDHGYESTGTTLVALMVAGGVGIIVNIGDSRLYRVRTDVMEQLTVDHTVRTRLLDAGVDPSEIASHGRSVHGLTAFLGRPTPDSRADISSVSLLNGDRMLLCSDGVHRQIRPHRLQALLSEGTCRQAAAALVDAADRAGGADNATAVVVEVGMVS